MPSISLACILKNEVKNIPQLLLSIPKCFDEIHFTDTGSTDGSVELIESLKNGNVADTPIYLHHFNWVNDFSAARNKSFEPVKTSYVMWMDLDDILSDAKAFCQWRDSVMELADYWVATYHYASDKDGKPTCSFARERVMSRKHGFKWSYFVHEGLKPQSPLPVSVQYTTKWAIIHKRTEEDQKQDVSRNLSIFEMHKTLDSRMTYYYGKELFENKRPLDAFPKLVDASSKSDLEHHDRIMAIQYACLCAMQLNQFERAIQLAHQGLQLEPMRAEFFVIIADCQVKLNKLKEALPFYEAATVCPLPSSEGVQSALFHHKESYTTYPLHQIAKIHFHTGQSEKALVVLKEAKRYGENEETLAIEKEIKKIQELAKPPAVHTSVHTEDLIITCHPTGMYEWDEEIYKERGIGGSETAVVEMARQIAELTGRKVLVFNNRDKEKTFGNVSYLPVKELKGCYQNKIPKAHLAWRHNLKLFEKPHYIWCHDLAIPGLSEPNYEKVLALSNFHKNYLMGMFNVPEEKILITKNGLNLDKFQGLSFEKDPMRIVFSSSPDRGLLRTMEVLDLVRMEYPVELYAYYGFDNMEKMGRGEEVKAIKEAADKRPWVHLCGNIEQKMLMNELSKASIWLYPTNFLETFCLTSLEMLGCKVWGIVRKWGGLPDTLRNAVGQCDIVESDCANEEERSVYADRVIDAIRHKKWETINYPLEPHSWQSVAKQFIEFLGL